MYSHGTPSPSSASAYTYVSAKSHQSSSHGSVWDHASTVGSSTSSVAYATSETAASQAGATPGAPYMRPVPLPSVSSHGLATPPESPTSARAPAPISIHNALRAQQPMPIMYNVLCSVNQVQVRPPYTSMALREPAATPLVTRIYINFPNIPAWSFIVENPYGVTVFDVLQKAEQVLHINVGRSEWAQYTAFQSSASSRFNTRTAGNESARQAGIKRLDYVDPLFAGLALSQATPGSWDIRFTSH